MLLRSNTGRNNNMYYSSTVIILQHQSHNNELLLPSATIPHGACCPLSTIHDLPHRLGMTHQQVAVHQHCLSDHLPRRHIHQSPPTVQPFHANFAIPIGGRMSSHSSAVEVDMTQYAIATTSTISHLIATTAPRMTQPDFSHGESPG